MSATSTAIRSLYSDPIRNFKYQVVVNHVANGYHLGTLGFTSVSGLQVTTEPILYREGGMNTTTRKMPGQSDFPPLVLSRGVFAGQPHEWEWFKQIFNWLTGVGSSRVSPEFRCNVGIRVLPHPTAATNIPLNGGGASPVEAVHGVVYYKAHNAWPVSWAHSDLDAGGNGIIVEQITLVHEGLVMVPSTKTSVGDYIVSFADENNA